MIDILLSTTNALLATSILLPLPSSIHLQNDPSDIILYETAEFTSAFMSSYLSNGTYFNWRDPYYCENTRSFSTNETFSLPLPQDGAVHRHKLYEMTYAAKGDFTYVISGNEVTIREGDFILMDTNCVHFDRKRVADVLLIYVSFSVPSFTSFASGIGKGTSSAQLLFSGIDRRQRYVIYRSPHDATVGKAETLLANILVEGNNMNCMYENVINAFSYRLLLLLDKHYAIESVTIGGNLRHDLVLVDLDRYIQHNIQTVTTESLENVFHFNRSYFNRLTKKKIGVTLTEYIQYKRMNEAKRLLLNTATPTNQIINMVGYKNSQYFYKMFTKDTGMTPTQYRKCHGLPCEAEAPAETYMAE